MQTPGIPESESKKTLPVSPFEGQVIKGLTDEEEATMGQVGSNSVGMAARFLQRHYAKKAAVLGEIITYNDFCSATDAKNLSFERFLVAKDREKKNDKETQERLERLRNEIESQWSDLIKFIIDRANEKPTRLDIVTLFIVDGEYQGGKEIKGHSEEVALPLKELLPLVMRALLDKEMILKQYKNLPEAEAEMRAQDDLALRWLSFFRFMQDAKLGRGRCSLGIRNGLVGLLSGVYPGVGILLDANTSIFDLLRNKTNQAFWHEWEDKNLSAERRKELRGLMIDWISSKNALPFLKQQKIDPENYLRELRVLYAKHGSNPTQLNAGIKAIRCP